jgi:hypothetical protein
MPQDSSRIAATHWRANSTYIRWVYDALLTLNIAFALVSIAFNAWPESATVFAHLEVHINETLGIRQTDLIRGYFEIAIPSILLAILMWTILRVSIITRTNQQLLLALGGIATLVAPAAFWIYIYELVGWPFRWPYRGAPFELAAILAFALLFLYDKWPVPGWCTFLVLLAHYLYWYWAPSTNPNMPNYSGPIAPILGFCASVAWVRYVTGSRQLNAHV